MPHGNLKDIARRRARSTGESHHRAVRALRELGPGGPAIPIADEPQRHLECLFLLRIGKSGAKDAGGWGLGDVPFCVEWVTPWTDSLELGVCDWFLPDIALAVMPRADRDSPGELYGIRGLRYRRVRAGVELFRLGLPGVLRLRGVSQEQWAAAVAIGRKQLGSDVVPLWDSHPDHLHPAERVFATFYDFGYTTTSRPRPELTTIASAFLRRRLAFKTLAGATCIDLWPGRHLELEWFDGPTHRQVLDILCDPVCGITGTDDHDPSWPDQYSVRLALADDRDAVLSLRRQVSRAGREDIDWAGRHRAQRRADFASAPGA